MSTGDSQELTNARRKLRLLEESYEEAQGDTDEGEHHQDSTQASRPGFASSKARQPIQPNGPANPQDRVFGRVRNNVQTGPCSTVRT